MAATIEITDITNDTQTGVFDTLMEAVGAQIESQYLNNRITGSDYANVYLGGLQAVLQQSIQFVLQQQLTEAQTNDVLKGTEVKTYQLDNVLPEELTKLQKEVLLVEEQVKNSYTERVAKDKQAAKLGLDNVMKLSETAKDSSEQFVYTPRYENSGV